MIPWWIFCVQQMAFAGCKQRVSFTMLSHCYMHSGFKSCRNLMWIALYASAFHPHIYHFSLVRTIVEITECINSQTSETLTIIPVKQVKISDMRDLKVGQSKAVVFSKEITFPNSTLEVIGIACRLLKFYTQSWFNLTRFLTASKCITIILDFNLISLLFNSSIWYQYCHLMFYTFSSDSTQHLE